MRESAPPDSLLETVRIPFVRRASLAYADGSGEHAFLVDIGVRGVFVERAAPLPEGTVVDVEFLLPGNSIPVRARCHFAWWNGPGTPAHSKRLPSGVGLEFDRMSDADRARVRAFVVEHLQTTSGRRRFHRLWPSSGEGDRA